MMIDLKEIGYHCKCFREELGYLQYEVAADIGYSVENVSAFENGRNDNLRILLWYILHGMTYNEIIGGVKSGNSL